MRYFPASLGVFRGVIISKTSIISKSNRAANSRKYSISKFEISEFRNAFEAPCHHCASLGREVERPSTRYQHLVYSRIPPWLIVRSFPTLGGAVAHGREGFVGVVYSRRYVHIQPRWYISSRMRRMHARIAALLAVGIGHTAVVAMVQQ